MSHPNPRPLDVVRTPGGGIAVVTEVSPIGDTWPARKNQVTASITYLDNPAHEYNAWWFREELTILGNLPELISQAMAHPFATHKRNAGNCYKLPQSNDNDTVQT